MKTGLLPPQQLRIATRAAKGLSNHDIAEELGLSENTVKTHLLIVFRRLGINRRQELREFHLQEKL